MKKKILLLLMSALILALFAVGCSDQKQEQTALQLEYEWLSATSIEITAVSGAEYSIDDGNTWQDSNVFSNLSSTDQYILAIRLKETATHYASAKTSKVATRGGLT